MRFLTAAALVGLGALSTGASTGGATGAAVPAPGARLLLTVHHGRFTSGELEGIATLECLPSGGTHPHAQAACAALLAAEGDFGRLRPVREEMCPMLIDPVTVTATGDWLFRPVAYSRTFPNRCAAERDTGGVFAF
jgi:hypothetical protein